MVCCGGWGGGGRLFTRAYRTVLTPRYAETLACSSFYPSFQHPQKDPQIYSPSFMFRKAFCNRAIKSCGSI